MLQAADAASAVGRMALRILRWLGAAPDNVPRVTVIDRISSVVSRVAMLLLVVIVLATFYEIVLRYLFGSPTLWANELTLWLGSVIFLIAGVHAMQRRAHIRITAVYVIGPRKVRKAFDVLAVAVVVGYAAMMISAGGKIALRTLLEWELSGTFWNPPIPATIKPLVLIATFIVALQAVNNLVVDTFGSRSED